MGFICHECGCETIWPDEGPVTESFIITFFFLLVWRTLLWLTFLTFSSFRRKVLLQTNVERETVELQQPLNVSRYLCCLDFGSLVIGCLRVIFLYRKGYEREIKQLPLDISVFCWERSWLFLIPFFFCIHAYFYRIKSQLSRYVYIPLTRFYVSKRMCILSF